MGQCSLHTKRSASCRRCGKYDICCVVNSEIQREETTWRESNSFLPGMLRMEGPGTCPLSSSAWASPEGSMHKPHLHAYVQCRSFSRAAFRQAILHVERLPTASQPSSGVPEIRCRPRGANPGAVTGQLKTTRPQLNWRFPKVSNADPKIDRLVLTSKSLLSEAKVDQATEEGSDNGLQNQGHPWVQGGTAHSSPGRAESAAPLVFSKHGPWCRQLGLILCPQTLVSRGSLRLSSGQCTHPTILGESILFYASQHHFNFHLAAGDLRLLKAWGPTRYWPLLGAIMC